jgi:hypothetical protein
MTTLKAIASRMCSAAAVLSVDGAHGRRNAVAAVLATSPGLGWSELDHRGHSLFPRADLMTDEEHKPKLTRRSIVALIQRARDPASR